MSDPDSTLPPVAPRQPNTLRTWLPRIWAWLLARPDWQKAAAAGFIAGATLPRFVGWWL